MASTNGGPFNPITSLYLPMHLRAPEEYTRDHASEKADAMRSARLRTPRVKSHKGSPSTPAAGMSLAGSLTIPLPPTGAAARSELPEAGKGLSLSRALKCFGIFDEIIPQLGAFEKTAKLLRDELFDAVFSSEFTAVGQGHLQRVPFFDLIKDAQRRQQEDQAGLARQMEAVAKREQAAHEMLEAERAAAAAAQDTVKDLEGQISLLQHQITSLTSDLNAARIHATRVTAEASAEAARHAAAAETARSQLAAAALATQELRPFKSEYANAQTTFDVLTARANMQRTVEVGSKAAARAEVGELTKLLRQFCTLRSRAIEDYDQRRDDPAATRRFMADMGPLLAEMAVVAQQAESLVQFSTEAPQRAAEHSVRKFSPVEPVSHRYSVLLQTSLDGRHFEPLPGTRHCVPCGGQATVCPHSPMRTSSVVTLPPGTTTLTITRPRFTLRHELNRGRSESVIAPPPMAAPLVKLAATRPPVPLGEPRRLSESFLEEMYMDLVRCMRAEDDLGAGIGSAQTFFYKYLERRYTIPDVATCVAVDVFTGLTTMTSNPKLDLFIKVLGGSRHAACTRFIALMHDLSDTLTLSSMTAFRAFVGRVYPGMSSDDVELLCLNFQAHCNGQVSHATVHSFLFQLTYDRRDPRILKALALLEESVGRSRGLVARSQFGAVAVQTHLPDNVWQPLFDEHAEVDGRSEPAQLLSHAADIAAYAQLLTEQQTIRQTLKAAKASDIVTKR
eukprot:m.70263 g.70263  ORF g.70263 m.70263 type:complete len:732 (-) comp12883_c0_seq2:83-2278(-)